MTNNQHTLPIGPDRVRDVIVVGGGAAGLSAGLTLARARRDVVVIDAGQPRNAPADAVHGLLTRDGIPPLELARLGRAEVESYGGQILTGLATVAGIDSNKSEGRFVVTVSTPDGRIEKVRGRRLVVATGLADELPNIPGIAERWGKEVVHCPYCHGWEIRDQAIGVLATGALAPHQALQFRQWSSNITLFMHDGLDLTDDQRDELAARDIVVVAGVVASLRIESEHLTGVTLASGRTVSVDALVVGVPVRSNAHILAGLGISAEQHPTGFGTIVPNEPLTGATSVPGVWVAGNVGDFRMQVVTAAASGVWVGAMVNMDLIAEETADALSAYRDPFSARNQARQTVTMLGD